VGHLDEHFGLSDVRIFDDVLSAVDGCDSRASSFELLEHLGAIPRTDPRRYVAIDEFNVVSSPATSLEPGLLYEFRVANECHDAFCDSLCAAGDGYPVSVSSLIGIAGCVIRRAVSVAFLNHPRLLVNSGPWADGRHNRLENVQVNYLTGSVVDVS